MYLVCLLLLVRLLSSVGVPLTGEVDDAAASANVKVVCVHRAQLARDAAVRSGAFKTVTSEELDRLVQSYTDTPALRQLASGYIGGVYHPRALQMHRTVRSAAVGMLKTCIEGTGLLQRFRRDNLWTIPSTTQLPKCTKKLHLIVVTSGDIKPSYSTTQQMLGSFRMRGIPLPGYLLRSGHNVSWYSLKEHEQLFSDCTTNPNYQFPFSRSDGSSIVALVVKQRPDRFMDCFNKHRIPVVLDLIDNTLEYHRFKDYKLILATNRLSSLIYKRNTGVNAVTLYHQPPNYAKFQRKDRQQPVRTIAMTHQRANHGMDIDVLAAAIGRYSLERNITFRLGEYSGHGFDQEEMRQFLMASHDWGSQIGYSMGYGSVDVGIVWLPCTVPEMICVKPTTRLVAYLSLGIPTIFIGAASYLDIVVEYGYPLVAISTEHAMELLDLLVRDGHLRQAVSNLGIKLAERFHIDTIADEFERAVCSVAQ